MLQLDDGLIVATAQPQRPAHRPMRGRIAVVHHQAVASGFERQIDLRFALLPSLERILEMREGQARIGAREGRIQPHRHLEEMPRLIVIRLVEAIHVP